MLTGYASALTHMLTLLLRLFCCCIRVSPTPCFGHHNNRPGRYRHDSFCDWGPVSEGDVWQVMLKLNSMTLQLVQQYKDSWQQAQQQQQQEEQAQMARRPQPQSQRGKQTSEHTQSSPAPPPSLQDHQQKKQQQPLAQNASSSVSWATAGFLAVSNSSGRKVPGLQLNLSRHTRRPLSDGAAASVSAGAAASGGGVQMQPQQGSMAASLHDGRHSSGTCSSTTTLSTNSTSSHSNSTKPTASQQPVAPAASSCAVTDPEAALQSAPAPDVTVITVSHFLPHPQLPHSRFSELTKAMGCLELQLQMQQVCVCVALLGWVGR